MSKVLLLLGGNKGNRIKMIEKAREMIRENVGEILNASSVYETEPWGFNSDKYFLNQVVSVKSYLSPREILRELLKIEKKLGRRRISKSYESRLIDIDILFYDDLQISDNDLHIPHPLLHKRKFALIPLVEIAGDIVHPILEERLDVLVQECKDKLKVELFVNAESPK